MPALPDLRRCSPHTPHASSSVPTLRESSKVRRKTSVMGNGVIYLCRSNGDLYVCYLSICLFFYIIIYLSAYLSVLIYLPIHLSVFLSIHLPICVCICRSICQPIFSSISLSMYMSCLFIHLSIRSSFSVCIFITSCWSVCLIAPSLGLSKTDSCDTVLLQSTHSCSLPTAGRAPFKFKMM